MHQVKISLDVAELEFINRHKAFGFKNRSAMVRAALKKMREKLEEEQMMASADLYAEIYQADDELQQITEAALEGWPE